MLDFSHLPDEGSSITIIERSMGSNEFQTWQKPKGCKIIFILCMGAGGGGGAGVGNTAGTARGGGGGGGGGSITTLTIPAMFVNDILFLQTGIGGNGAIAGGAAATPGSLSTVRAFPVALGGNTLCLGGGGNAGGTPVVGNAGNGGAGGSITTTSMAQAFIGQFQPFTGGQGVVGGSAGAAGANGTASGGLSTLSQINMGGAGGASIGTNNVEFVGGVSSSTGYTNGFNIPGGIIGGGNGQPGFENRKPRFHMAGSGGGSNATGKGGNGGDGAIGCGGSGGGAGLTGGNGGNGGNGMIVIIAY